MYKELFEKNKDAIVFLKEEECLDDSEINSISPMRHTKLNSKTIVGIADLMTRFAEKQANGVDKSIEQALLIRDVSKSPITAVRSEVQWFALEMEKKLALNDHKGGWKDCEVDALIKRLKEETQELEDEWWKRKNDFGRSASEGFMFTSSNEELIKECADIANFAMMVASLFKEE